MQKMEYSKRKGSFFITISLILFLTISMTSCARDPNGQETDPDQQEDIVDPSLKVSIEAMDDGKILSYASNDYYRYGPSIMRYDDGSMDMWYSSPGNSSTQWDWIRYRHSDDGINWSSEQIVLKPTPGSKDQCSVCDPDVFYYDGYYYLGYTGTEYYEGDGSNNMAFAARSQYPDGPFEKWNGSGWGGYPEPILTYEDDPDGWGVGEPCFVILNDDIFIYYTYSDLTGLYTDLAKADLTENWPSTIRYKNTVLARNNQDSLDVAYDEELGIFIAFTMDLKMTENSRLILYGSGNGKEFTDLDSTKGNIEDYAHNVGFAKTPEGHINSSQDILLGYGYGKNWGRWNLKIQTVRIHRQ